MYNPPTFLTLDVVAQIAEEFTWPAPYTLEDDQPDGIVFVFPKCALIFQEGFESDMYISFPVDLTQTPSNLRLEHALSILVPEAREKGIELPTLDETFIPSASLEKVEIGIRNLCVLSLTYLEPCILGDFSWVERFKSKTGLYT